MGRRVGGRGCHRADGPGPRRQLSAQSSRDASRRCHGAGMSAWRLAARPRVDDERPHSPLRSRSVSRRACCSRLTAVAIWRVGDVNDKLDEVGVFEDDLEHVQQHTAAVVDALTHPEMDARKLPSRVSAGLVPFFRYLNRCTAPTDRLLVSGPYPDVFVLARRGFAGGHIAFLEAFYHSDADQQLTLQRMTRESVPFVVLPLDDQDAFARSFPLVLAHVTAAYDRAGRYPGRRTEGYSHPGRTGTAAHRHRQLRPAGRASCRLESAHCDDDGRSGSTAAHHVACARCRRRPLPCDRVRSLPVAHRLFERPLPVPRRRAADAHGRTADERLRRSRPAADVHRVSRRAAAARTHAAGRGA